MRFLLILLNGWLTIGLFSLADDYNLSREVLGKWFIAIGLGFISTLVHEVGHAVAAWRVGYKVQRIAVLPIEFDLIHRRLTWASVPGSDVAGYVKVAPLPGAKRRDAIWFVLGGPLAEALLATVLFASLALSMPSTSMPSSRAVEIAAAVDFRSSSNDHAAGLPVETVVRQRLETQRRWEVLRGLATMLAVFAMGSALINLLPIGGSDGDHLRKLIRSRP